jgi:hypothetical protein
MDEPIRKKREPSITYSSPLWGGYSSALQTHHTSPDEVCVASYTVLKMSGSLYI